MTKPRNAPDDARDMARILAELAARGPAKARTVAARLGIAGKRAGMLLVRLRSRGAVAIASYSRHCGSLWAAAVPENAPPANPPPAENQPKLERNVTAEDLAWMQYWKRRWQARQERRTRAEDERR